MTDPNLSPKTLNTCGKAFLSYLQKRFYSLSNAGLPQSRIWKVYHSTRSYSDVVLTFQGLNNEFASGQLPNSQSFHTSASHRVG